MALEIKGIPRVFMFDGKELQDPNPDLTPQEVMDLYSANHPELNNGKVVGPEIKDDRQEFTFSAVLGEKG